MVPCAVCMLPHPAGLAGPWTTPPPPRLAQAEVRRSRALPALAACPPGHAPRHACLAGWRSVGCCLPDRRPGHAAAACVPCGKRGATEPIGAAPRASPGAGPGAGAGAGPPLGSRKSGPSTTRRSSQPGPNWPTSTCAEAAAAGCARSSAAHGRVSKQSSACSASRGGMRGDGRCCTPRARVWFGCAELASPRPHLQRSCPRSAGTPGAAAPAGRSAPCLGGAARVARDRGLLLRVLSASPDRAA